MAAPGQDRRRARRHRRRDVRATQAILAALLERELGDGTGQKIDVSLLDGQAAWTSYMAANYFASGEPPGRMGSKHPNIAPYQAFETRDGYVVVACASDAFWPRLCEALDRPDLLADDRFGTNEKRVRNRDALDPELDAAFADLTTQDALDRLDEHGVPASPVRDMAEVFDDPQLAARNMIADRRVRSPDRRTDAGAGVADALLADADDGPTASAVARRAHGGGPQRVRLRRRRSQRAEKRGAIPNR